MDADPFPRLPANRHAEGTQSPVCSDARAPGDPDLVARTRKDDDSDERGSPPVGSFPGRRVRLGSFTSATTSGWLEPGENDAFWAKSTKATKPHPQWLANEGVQSFQLKPFQHCRTLHRAQTATLYTQPTGLPQAPDLGIKEIGPHRGHRESAHLSLKLFMRQNYRADYWTLKRALLPLPGSEDAHDVAWRRNQASGDLLPGWLLSGSTSNCGT